MSNLSTDYDVRLATLKKLGGDMSKKYATIYDVDLAILDKIGQGGGGGGSTVWGDIYGDIKDQKDLIDLISQSGGGSLTPEQEEAIEKLVNANEGVLITKEIKSLDYYDNYLPNVYSSKYIANEHITPGEAYFVSNNALWKFNYESISFEKIVAYAPNLSDNIVWKDNSGRYYNGNSQINIETGDQIKVVDGIAYVVQNYNYASTLFKFGNELLNINLGEIKRFNESTQAFDLISFGAGSIATPISFEIMYYEGDIIAPTYNARLVKVDDNTYQWESYTAPFETTLPDGYPFDRLNNIHYVEGVGYVYAYGNNNFYKLVDGHWERFEVNPVGEYTCCIDFNSTYSIGSLIIASFYDRMALVNAGNDFKTTSWSDATDMFVDLKSEQTIKGTKSFQQITTDGINAGYIGGKSQELTIYADKNLKLSTSETGKINLNTNRLVKQGFDIATLNDTICNPETKYIGPDYKQVQLENDICTSFRGIVVLHNGRIFSFSYSESYEFVGNTWRTVDFGLGFNYSEVYRTFKITSDKVYFIDPNNSNIYEFTGDEFIQKTSDGTSSYGSVIPLGDTLYDYSTSKKLNTTTWEWESVNAIGNISGQEPMYYKVINGNTYNFNGSQIYKYNSETNSFEEIIDGYTYDGNFGWFNNANVFTYESDAYFTTSSGVFKFNTVNNTIERVNIYYNENDNAAYFEYDSKLYTSFSCMTGYTYEIKYNKPALPNNGLDYALTAKSTDGKVNYSYTGIWSGTQAEWDALPVETQNTIKIALITE